MDTDYPVSSDTAVRTVTVPVTVRLESGTSLHLEVHDNLANVAPSFFALRDGPFHTVFNSTNWLSNWLKHRQTQESPCFVTAHDDHGAAFFWPMAIQKRYATRILGWLGQSEFSINLGMYRPDIARQLTQKDCIAIFRALHKNVRSFDAVHLLNQPETWNATRNPMAALTHHEAANSNYERALSSDYDAMYTRIFSSRERRNHARQRRRLAEYGSPQIDYVTKPQEQREVLDTFFTFKTAQLQQIGAPNPFRSERTKAFYRDALATTAQNGGETTFARLCINGEIVATLIGLTERKRFTTLMSAITLAPVSKASPGQYLLEDIVQKLCERGIEIFDFGPGPSAQKQRWEMDPRPLFNTYLALTPRAYPATWIAAASSNLHRALKRNERVFNTLTHLRARIVGS